MKTSNIILISIFVLGLMLIVALQLYLKSITTDQKNKEFVLTPNAFTSLKIESGWDVQIQTGDSSKITFSKDSIRDLIVFEGESLILKNTNNDSIRKVEISVTIKKIDQISISGNSHAYCQSDFIDSINIQLFDKSELTIIKTKTDNEKSKINDPTIINYASVALSQKSHLIIYNNINSLYAELKDSSHFSFSGNIQIEKLSKSKGALLRTW